MHERPTAGLSPFLVYPKALSYASNFYYIPTHSGTSFMLWPISLNFRPKWTRPPVIESLQSAKYACWGAWPYCQLRGREAVESPEKRSDFALPKLHWTPAAAGSVCHARATAEQLSRELRIPLFFLRLHLLPFQAFLVSSCSVTVLALYSVVVLASGPT